MFKRRWHDHMIIEHIMSRHKKEPLNSYYYSTHYPDVYAAAERIFGSWRETIEVCGFKYEDIRKYREWSREKVLQEIKDLKKKGSPINSQYAQDYQKPLYMAAIKRFKNWGAALTAAGIDYTKIRLRRKMSKKEIKKEILELYSKNIDLAYPHMREKYQYLLAAAMKKWGDGSWAEARRRVGILTNYRLPVHKRGEKQRNRLKVRF
jgi:hypothetical protein